MSMIENVANELLSKLNWPIAGETCSARHDTHCQNRLLVIKTIRNAYALAAAVANSYLEERQKDATVAYMASDTVQLVALEEQIEVAELIRDSIRELADE